MPKEGWALSFIRRPGENYCPGIEDFVRPRVEYQVCPECGGRLEYWSDEERGVCLDCGFEVAKENPTPSCLEYCEYADKCRGIILSKRRR
ncbi:MAG TPA: hypothetical protein ENF19_02860 [Candidatus Bathyarchaeota archaeon]|nr:hypothetical protein [Candidatus Bathyarchaeota archaeon]